MAVRTDFTAGEVLTAQDLDDTFASKLPYSFGTATPSTTDSGFLWYDSNSTPAVAKYWDGSAFETLAPAPGLELITSETFSAVSSVSVNGCFSSSYGYYRIILHASLATGNANLAFRFRVGGSDDSSAAYNNATLQCLTGGVSNWYHASGATNYLLSTVTTTPSGVVVDLQNPFDSSPKNATQNSSETAGSRFGGLYFTNSTSFDGFTIYPTGSTITGELRVYGYKD